MERGASAFSRIVCGGLGLLLGVLAGTISAFDGTAKEDFREGRPPAVDFLLADELGYGDVGFNEPAGPHEALRAGSWKKVRFAGVPRERNGLAVDPGETTDRASAKAAEVQQIGALPGAARRLHPAVPLKRGQPPAPPGQAYYIDSAAGEDGNDGRSPEAAWATLAKINASRFEPGDRILFRAGSVWHGQLVPQGSGAPGRPIVINRYGEGARPVLHGEGEQDYTLLLENVQHWEVEGLELTNRGPTRRGGRRGLIVRAEDMGDCRHLYLRDLVIRDVNGSLVKKDRGGGSAILIQNGGERVPTRFIDLRIEDCHLYRCERNGINFRGNTNRDAWHPSLGVVIRGNRLEQIPGDGIVPIGCDGALVEHNVMRDGPDILSHEEAAAGIWPWSSDHTVIQFNEVSGHNAKWDGQGFDADFNCIGTIIQYNYSHDNAGGFLLVCNKGDSLGSDHNIGTVGTIVRYNVSVNDGIRAYPTRREGWFSPVFHLTGPIRDTRIHNNVIILPRRRTDAMDSRIVEMGDWGGGWPEQTLIANNIFIAPDSAGFPAGGDSETRYTHNAYFGSFATLPEDPAAVRADPLLVDASARGDGFAVLRNFLLQEGSPCLDAGLPLGSTLTDLAGRPVPGEGPVSIGIGEAISGTVPRHLAE